MSLPSLPGPHHDEQVLDIPYVHPDLQGIIRVQPGLFTPLSVLYPADLYALRKYAVPARGYHQGAVGQGLGRGQDAEDHPVLYVRTPAHDHALDLLPGRIGRYPAAPVCQEEAVGIVPEGVDHVGLYLGDEKIIHSSSNNEKVFVENLEKAEMFKNIVGYRRVVGENDLRFVVSIPSERLDLKIKEDLVEEIGRIYGYKNIESTFFKVDFKPKINKTFYYSNKIRKILNNLGFSEVYTYVFTEKGKVKVSKPLASHLGFLREKLLFGIRKSLDLNEKNAPLLGLDEIKIFEIGKVFPSIDGEHLSFALGVRSTKKKKKEKAEKEIFEKVKNEFFKEFGVDLEPEFLDGVFEMNFDKLVERLPEPSGYEDVLPAEIDDIIRYKKISSYPFVLRDISVWVPNEKKESDVLNLIKENAGDLLVQTKMFDKYSPDGERRTSYAFNLVFQSSEKTLTDDEINKIMQEITEKMLANSWEVR